MLMKEKGLHVELWQKKSQHTPSGFYQIYIPIQKWIILQYIPIYKYEYTVCIIYAIYYFHARYTAWPDLWPVLFTGLAYTITLSSKFLYFSHIIYIMHVFFNGWCCTQVSSSCPFRQFVFAYWGSVPELSKAALWNSQLWNTKLIWN